MFKSLKLSLFVAVISGVFAVGAYAYALWNDDSRQKAAVPVEGVSVFTRDLTSYHAKRGSFPDDLSRLEGVVWEQKEGRKFSANKHGLVHKNYYYIYNRLSAHLFTLWAVPTGEKRDEAATWFLIGTPNVIKRWKGASLPFEQLDAVEPNPSLNKLGTLGLIEQPAVDLKTTSKASSLFAN